MALTITGVSISGLHASKYVPPTGILTFTTPTSASVTMQNSLTNTATSTLSGGSYGAITYASSNTAIATVNSTTGVVTPVAPGSCIITATQAATSANSLATQTYTLTVNALPVGTITFTTPSSASVNMGNNLTNTATSTLSGGSYGAITYSSSNTAIATVGLTTGVVTPVAPGSCVITATQAAVTGVNAQATQTYTLTVNSGVSFSPTLSSNTPNTTYTTSNTWSTTHKATNVTLSNGNLTATGTGLGMCAIASSGVSSGKWYWETTVLTAGTYNVATGIALSTINVNAAFTSQGANTAFLCYAYDGSVYSGTTTPISTTGTQVAWNTVGTVIGIALDLTNNYIAWYKNGTLMVYCPIPSGQTWYPAIGDGTSTSWSQSANFGNTQLIYSPPSGFTSGIGGTGTHSTNELWNAARKAASITISGSLNTVLTNGSAAVANTLAYYSIPLNTKVYWETSISYSPGNACADYTGIALSTMSTGSSMSTGQGAGVAYTYGNSTGHIYNGAASVVTGTANAGAQPVYTGIAVDTTVGAMNIKIYNAGTLIGTAAISDGTYYPAYGMTQLNESASANFGTSAFHNSVPTGYVSLNSVL